MKTLGTAARPVLMDSLETEQPVVARTTESTTALLSSLHHHRHQLTASQRSTRTTATVWPDLRTERASLISSPRLKHSVLSSPAATVGPILMNASARPVKMVRCALIPPAPSPARWAFALHHSSTHTRALATLATRTVSAVIETSARHTTGALGATVLLHLAIRSTLSTRTRSSAT